MGEKPKTCHYCGKVITGKVYFVADKVYGKDTFFDTERCVEASIREDCGGAYLENFYDSDLGLPPWKKIVPFTGEE